MSKLVYISSNVSLGPMARNSISGLNDQHARAFPGVTWSLPWEFYRFAMADFYKWMSECSDAQACWKGSILLVESAYWSHSCSRHDLAQSTLVLAFREPLSVPGHTVSKGKARRNPECQTCNVMLQSGQCSPHLPWSWSCLRWSS